MTKTINSNPPLHARFVDDSAFEVGLDEAGRGALAGPVSVCALILPAGFTDARVRDSKKLNENERAVLAHFLCAKVINFSVCLLGREVIDEINILSATMRAMHLCLDRLRVTPARILVDGNRFVPYKNIPHHCIIGGDNKYMAIAAASIIAKFFRDSYMRRAHDFYPAYHWNTNKGYGSSAHVLAIHKYGRTPLHRETFRVPALR